MAILRSRPSSKEDDEGRQTGLYRRSAIIRRISEAVDLQLRQEQAGFRKGCTDQIFTLCNIIEQCTEWQRQLYIKKTFDSIHRECLWRILKSYGIPKQIILVIKSFFNNFKCRVGNSESSFDVKTGVRQGCPMSALLFNLTIDWVMQQTTTDRVRGIRWTLLSTLEDLDFADDVELFSHTHQHMQEKTTRLGMSGQQVGLKVSQKKTEVMILNVSNPSPIKVNGEDLPTTEEFTYPGSTVRHDGGAGSDIKNRLNKARNTIIPVQHQDQAKAVPELRTPQPIVRLRMLEDD